jgi:hypothetical protein
MAGRPRRSASDALKGTLVPQDAPDTVETAPAGEQADTTADAPAGGSPDTADTTDAGKGDVDGQDATSAPADTEDSTPEADDADVDDDLEADDDLVEIRVIVDAFNYFEDGTHQTARKGEVIVVERHVAERGLSLNALTGTGDDQD